MANDLFNLRGRKKLYSANEAIQRLDTALETNAELTGELKFVTHLHDTNIFKTNKVRQLPEYLAYAKIIMYILTDESILEIFEGIREEYYAT